MQAHKLKKVALRLASLERRDRRWILRRLPAEARKPIERHMKALLGIAGQDPALMAEISRSLEVSALSPSGHMAAAVQLKSVPDPVMERMIAVLQEAPPNWAAAILKAQPAGIRDTYIETCDAARQAELTAALVRVPDALPPRLAEAIRICLEDRESGESGEARGVRQPSFEELLRGGAPATDGAAA